MGEERIGKSLGRSEEEEEGDTQPSPIRNLQGAHGNPHFLGKKRGLNTQEEKKKKPILGLD